MQNEPGKKAGKTRKKPEKAGKCRKKHCLAGRFSGPAVPVFRGFVLSKLYLR